MTVAYQSPSTTLLAKPSTEELRDHLPPPAIPKILRHLDPTTGAVALGEVQCIGIAEVDYNPWSIRVVYETLRPDGKRGSQFMNFYPWSAVMRCLAVTMDGRVVMLQEHRRARGAWVEGMHVAGGIKEGSLVSAVKDELFLESGCKKTDASRILHVGSCYMDDGVFSDPLPLLTIDRVSAPAEHQNPDECIRGIMLVPWVEWREMALDGVLDDVYATVFAARCTLDEKTGRVHVRGLDPERDHHRVLLNPAEP